MLQRGPETSSRFSVVPGSARNRDNWTALSPLSLHLWQAIILPQLRRTPASGHPRARAFARDVCKRVPFLELGVVGPSEVYEELSELAAERLVNADSVELTGKLYSLDILSCALFSREDTVGRLLKKQSDRSMQGELIGRSHRVLPRKRLRSATSSQHLWRSRPRP